ncbi:TPR6 [Auxenochlorella protothecoides x Auxenochlorella symbiontica]
MCKTMGDATVSYKARGNEEYAKRNFLKAAALYTHGLQADPKNATLYSNRSAALLNLNKVTKALADAEACISLRPDWDKGYFRKGLALEAAGKGQEALEAYQQASQLGEGENNQAALKVRQLTKQLGKISK